MTMKRSGKTFICLLSSFALATGVRAVTSDLGGIKHGEITSSIVSDDSYGAIVRRNIFDLKEPDTNSFVPPVNPPPPNVTLTGIMTIFGRKQALFMVQKPASLGKPSDAPESSILSEGERQGGLEVLAIDQKGAKVTIKNDGIVSTITFEAPKPVASAPTNPPVAHMSRTGFRPNLDLNAATPPPPIP